MEEGGGEEGEQGEEEEEEEEKEDRRWCLNGKAQLA
jgi:hypothetical protein